MDASAERGPSLGRLAGKVAVVTGAGSGMGEAMVELFCREGARVVAADISGKQDELAKRIGDGCLAVRADVTKADDVQAMLAAATDEFGSLDILCNNAGIAEYVIDEQLLTTPDVTEEKYDKVMDVNARGTFLGLHYGIPLMMERGGSIINTASIASFVGIPWHIAYCGSKGAVMQMTKAAAIEFGPHNIRINAICPAGIESGMSTRPVLDDLIGEMTKAMPLRRIGKSSEIASAALFLASDESAFITGTSIVVDGGLTAQ